MKKIKSVMSNCLWSIKLAWSINRKMFLSMLLVSLGLSILPAIAISLNQQILYMLGLSNDIHQLSNIMGIVIAYGFVILINGISARFNTDLLEMLMYDSYYIGLQDRLIECAKHIDLLKFLSRSEKDEYISVALRDSALNTFFSSFCTLCGKILGIISLLVVIFKYSLIIGLVSTAYIIGVIILNLTYVEKTRKDDRTIRRLTVKANYYENLPKSYGIAKEIRLFNTAQKILDQWKTAYTPIDTYEKKRKVSMEMRSWLSGVCFYGFTIMAISIAVTQVTQHKMRPDILLAFFSLSVSLFNAISSLAKLMMKCYLWN